MVKVGIVFGGPSSEHEVSLAGAKNVLEAFENVDGYEAQPIGIGKDGSWYTGAEALPVLLCKADQKMLVIDAPALSDEDMVAGQASPPLSYIDDCEYIMLFIPGNLGEDGGLQGFFEVLGKKIIGCDVLASALCFDKAMLKATLAGYGYDVTPGADVHLDRTDITPALYDKICADLGTNKLVLKPTDNGSSLGLSQAENFEEFKAGLAEAGKYTNHVMVEKFIAHKEVLVGIIGQGEDLFLSELVQSYEVTNAVFGYDEKYVDTKPCMIPAPIDANVGEKIKKYAADIYRLVKCSGWVRIDFFVETGTNKVYVNEINTSPGMCSSSLFPTAFKSIGLDYAELMNKILEMAVSE